MKSTRKIAFCGVLCALSTVILLATFFPYATYALAALAGIVFIPAALEMGPRYGICCYVVTALLASVLTPDPEAKVLFVLFFGYYPVLQLRLQLWHKTVASWVVKLAVFNVAVVSGFWIATALLGVSTDEFTIAGVYLPGILLLLGNVVFVVYDVALVRVGVLYRVRIHPLVSRYFR